MLEQLQDVIFNNKVLNFNTHVIFEFFGCKYDDYFDLDIVDVRLNDMPS
jgi:hypothetical protein